VRLFIGTYTKQGGRGIYSAQLNLATGALSEPELVAATANPTFLALSPSQDVLYAVSEGPELAVAYRIDPASGALRALGQSGSGHPAPCHITVDRTGRTVLVTNYHSSILAAIPVAADGGLGPPHVLVHRGSSVDPVRQTAAHVHSATVSPDNRFAIVCDLGQDRIFTYALDAAAAELAPAAPPFVATRPGAGPRHFAFAPDGRHGYAINEIDGTIATYAYAPATGALTPQSIISTLPPDFTGPASAAELRFHPSGRWLYASNRGHDSLVCFRVEPDSGALTALDWFAAGGRNPRHFTLTPDGAWLICCHQDSNTISVFAVDPDSGRLRQLPDQAHVSMPVCALLRA